MVPLVTAITEDYLPGAKALINSFLKNGGDKFRLHVLSQRRFDFDSFVSCLPYPKFSDRFPVNKRWPVECPEMYARLWLPLWFGSHRRVIWIDADCIVLDKLDELAELEFDEPIAAVGFEDDRYTLKNHIPEIDDDVHVPFSGLIVFNIPKWNKFGLTEKCWEVMQRTDLTFEFAVQSVLAYVVRDNFYKLHPDWQVFANRRALPHRGKILHWVGGLPWRDEMNNADIWRQYA